MTPTPDPDSTFPERFEHLVRELTDLLDAHPEIEVEPQGTEGLRMRYDPTDREVRLTPLEEQALVHFVFGHTTLGTLHRAEHHASHPFGGRSPDVPRLWRQIEAFLVEGIHPRWLTERPAPDSPAARRPDESSAILELPLD
ncbi:MAG: hypothetical protein ABR559_02585 [Gemmatimonadota bacterium]